MRSKHATVNCQHCDVSLTTPSASCNTQKFDRGAVFNILNFFLAGKEFKVPRGCGTVASDTRDLQFESTRRDKDKIKKNRGRER